MTSAEELADLRQRLADYVASLRQQAKDDAVTARLNSSGGAWGVIMAQEAIAAHIEALLVRERDEPGRLIAVSLTEQGFEPVFAFGERGE